MLLPAGSAPQQQSTNLESQTEPFADSAHEQTQQSQQQFDNQHYSAADWAAYSYWQYYGKSPVARARAESSMLNWAMWWPHSFLWCCRANITATTPAATATTVPQAHALVGAAVC